jgi:hypothetical protein
MRKQLLILVTIVIQICAVAQQKLFSYTMALRQVLKAGAYNAVRDQQDKGPREVYIS